MGIDEINRFFNRGYRWEQGLCIFSKEVFRFAYAKHKEYLYQNIKFDDINWRTRFLDRKNS